MASDLSPAACQGKVIPISEATVGVTDCDDHSDVAYPSCRSFRGRSFGRMPIWIGSWPRWRRRAWMSASPGATSPARCISAASGLRDAAMVAARGTPLIPGSRNPRDCGNHFGAVPYIHVITPDRIDPGASVWVAQHSRRIFQRQPPCQELPLGRFHPRAVRPRITGSKPWCCWITRATGRRGPGSISPCRNTVFTARYRRAGGDEPPHGRPLRRDRNPRPAQSVSTRRTRCHRQGGSFRSPRPQRLYGNDTPGPVALAAASGWRVMQPAYRTEIAYGG